MPLPVPVSRADPGQDGVGSSSPDQRAPRERTAEGVHRRDRTPPLVKGYVLWRRDASPVVRRDREGDDRLRLVASLEDLVPLGAEIAGLVIDDAPDSPHATADAQDDDALDDRPLAPVVPLFGVDRPARRRRRHR
jgi:hypothetical protein